MRTLHLLRHAKSSWDEPSQADRDRPLSQRGVEDASLVADHLRRERILPGVVLCSSARRTRETLDLLGSALLPECDVRIEDELYAATADELMARLRTAPSDAQQVLVLGHNPGLQRLGVLVASSGRHLPEMAQKLPTAALATLEASISGWPELAEGCAELVRFVRPADLRPRS